LYSGSGHLQGHVNSIRRPLYGTIAKGAFVPIAAFQISIGSNAYNSAIPVRHTNNTCVIYFVDIFIEGHILLMDILFVIT
jgi:hypothetical protein